MEVYTQILSILKTISNSLEYDIIIFKLLVNLKHLVSNVTPEQDRKITSSQYQQFGLNQTEIEIKIYNAECHFERYYADLVNNMIDLKIKFPCYDAYFRQIQAEINKLFLTLESSSRDNIRCVYSIGCGSLPITAILWYMLTGLPVIGIDFDQIAVDTANHLLVKLGLTNKIKVICQKGESFNYQRDSLAIIANMATNLPSIINQIDQSSVEIYIVRNSNGLRSIYYPSHESNQDLSPNYYPSYKTDPYQGYFISTSQIFVRINQNTKTTKWIHNN